MSEAAVRVSLGMASIGAGAIHLLVTPEHFEEFTAFGVFFLVLGIFQILWAAVVLVRANTLALISGVAVSILTIGIWVLSRTAGLPIGPEAGEPEAFGLMDTLASGLEALIVLGGIYLLIQRRAERPLEEPAWDRERRAA